MRKARFYYFSAIISMSLLVVLGGCMGKSQPSRFYMLSQVSEDKNVRVSAGSDFSRVIGVGPVKIADYLDQSQIVSRSDNNRVIEAEFDLWSGSLTDNVTHVLAENIGYLLSTKRVFLFPWKTYMPIDYQVEVAINHLDGKLGKEAVLVARWQIIRVDTKELLVMQRSEIRKKTESDGYDGLVEAQSRALGLLSREIAEALRASVK